MRRLSAGRRAAFHLMESSANPGWARHGWVPIIFLKENEMELRSMRPLLGATLLALALAGCQKADEVPAPEVIEPDAQAPAATPSDPAPMTEPAPTEMPMEPVPGEAGEAAPTQPATEGTPDTSP